MTVKLPAVKMCDACRRHEHVRVCPNCNLRLCRDHEECPECDSATPFQRESDPDGLRLRFFSERVFGAWVDGVVERVLRPRQQGRCHRLVISAHFQGHHWREKVPADREFYYPPGHPLQGEPFTLPEYS